MKNNNDPRIKNALKLGLNEFNTTNGEKIVWNIDSIIGFGGSAITYLANMPQLKKQFILKEYFPHIFANDVIRVGTSLEIDASKKESWSNGLIHFKEEIKLQDELPLSSTDGGGELFIYAIDHFSANKTEYIVFDTDGSITLKDYFENLHKKINETPSQNNKRDNAYLKTLLQSTITVCEALSALHNRNWLHMDISDTNILIHPKSQKVHLTDLASAVKYDPEKLDYSDVTTSYTPSFSPIEQKSLSLGNRKVLLNFECDTYSLCAVLYKCLFDNSYDPIINDLDLFLEDNAFVETPKIPLCPNLSEPLKKKLILILKTGLSGMGYRYKTACELCDVLSDLLEKIRKEESSVNKSKQALIYGGGGALLLILVLIFGFWLIPARPNISAEMDSIYTQGETIDINILIYDVNNAGIKSVNLESLKHIKLNGFEAEGVSFVEIPTEKKDAVAYKLSLENISAVDTGKKTVSIGKIYKSFPILGKSNKPLKLEFYYGNNISCDISEPSVTKVSSNTGNCVEYILQFYSPVDFEINLNQVQVHGFTSENTVSKYLGNNKFSLTFENIVGEPGNDKYFVLYDSTAKDDTIYHSKKTVSPSFEIIEDGISDSRISVEYSVLKNNFKNGGHIILSPKVDCAEYYSCNLSKYELTLNGFEADFYFSDREDIILYNIKIDKNAKEYSVLIDEGCFIAENGSRNTVITCNISNTNELDTTPPSIRSICIVDKNSNFVAYKLNIDDNNKNISFNGDPKDYIELIDFDATILTTIYENTCYVCLQNIKPLTNSKEFYIKIKDGIAIDDAGNLSQQINSERFKIN